MDHASPWLEDDISLQLRLALRWCEDVESKADTPPGASTIQQARAEGLYKDDGSSLEIVEEIGFRPKHKIWILRAQPLTVCDGDVYVKAKLTPECQQSFFEYERIQSSSPLPHTVACVRRYTVRVTSYGPPYGQLTVVLNSVDWHQAAIPAPLGQDHLHAKPLWLCEGITDTIRRLQNRTAIRDCSFLLADQMPVPGQNLNAGTMPDTQLEYGTQLPHTWSNHAGEDSLVSGSHRLEPVLAGSTRRDERIINDCEAKRHQVLSLLGHTGETREKLRSLPSAGGFSRPTMGASSTHDGDPNAQTPAPAPINRLIDARHRNPNFPPLMSMPAIGSTEKENMELPSHGLLQVLPTWLGDKQPTAKSTDIPRAQRKLLKLPESWHKPLPGKRFPSANVPIETLEAMKRYSKARKAVQSTRSSISTDDLVAFNSQAPASLPAGTALPSSQISWSRSPTPEPIPGMPSDGIMLPPDSSGEDRSRPINSPKLHPRARNRPDKQIHVPQAVEGRLTSPLPPSSPPPIDARSESDMEMEEDVPRPLGRDSGAQDRPLEQSVGGINPAMHDSQRWQSATSGHMPPMVQESDQAGYEEPLGQSVVCATYDNHVEQQDEQPPAANGDRRSENIDAVPDNSEVENILVHDRCMHEVVVDMVDTPVSSLIQPQSPIAGDLNNSGSSHIKMEPTPISAQRPPPDLSSSGYQPAVTVTAALVSAAPQLVVTEPSSRVGILPKRKHLISPSKEHAPRPKRREIKIVNFGNTARVKDIESDIEQARRESLERFREARRSISAAVSTPLEHSPALESDRDDRPEEIPCARTIGERDPHAHVVTNASSKITSLSSPILSPTAARIQSAAHPAFTTAAHSSQNREEHMALPGGSDVVDPMLGAPCTLFDRFCNEYPAYPGNRQHFMNQCRQMIKLDVEDKMVPKWQWDDYIIRHKTDYAIYAMQCVNEGEELEPYHRFYKDQIRNIVYTKGVVQGRRALVEALAEMTTKSSSELNEMKISLRVAPNAIGDWKQPHHADRRLSPSQVAAVVQTPAPTIRSSSLLEHSELSGVPVTPISASDTHMASPSIQSLHQERSKEHQSNRRLNYSDPVARMSKGPIRESLPAMNSTDSADFLGNAQSEKGVNRSNERSLSFDPGPMSTLTKSRRSISSAHESSLPVEERPYTRDRGHGAAPRPRHSLPARRIHTKSAQPSILGSSAQQPNSNTPHEISHLAPHPRDSLANAAHGRKAKPSRIPAEPTGDPYRDFAFGMQRVTSLTGSTQAIPGKKWPASLAVRPPMGQPGRTHDVL